MWDMIDIRVLYKNVNVTCLKVCLCVLVFLLAELIKNIVNEKLTKQSPSMVFFCY